MIKFIERNKEIISILSIGLLVTVLTGNANASTVTTNNNNFLTEQAQPTNSTSKEVFLLSKEKRLEQFNNKGSLTDHELKELLSLVGFKGRNLIEAWSIAKRESNGQPIRFNGNVKTGDSSYGLFQINMIGDLGPDRRNKFELESNSDLLNPVINAQIAFHMSQGGEDWSSWKGMTPRAVAWSMKFPS